MSNLPPDEEESTKYYQDFINGCLAFLLIAMMIRGDAEDQTPEEKFNEFLDPLVGNRNKEETQFSDVMPDLYKKVIEYCHEAVVISDQNSNNERL